MQSIKNHRYGFVEKYEDRYNHDYEMIDEYNFPTKEENSEKDTETSTLKD